MITTFGRRRSARATALAPSDASPITLMCGARESESRSPSLTTSWSSTIRQVISGGVDTGQDDMRLYRQRKLLRLRGRGQPHLSAVADPVPPREPGHLFTDGFGDVRSEISLAGVEPFVVRQLLWPVLGEVFEEVLARPGPEEQEVRPDAGRARLPCGANDLTQLLRPVGDPRQDRRHAHARLYAGV